ncbi:MAG: DUF6265 family protein [Pseudomonadota bacterium]
MTRNFTLMLTALVFWASSAAPLSAQEVLHETPDYNWPPATLEQASWLNGTWRGVAEDGSEALEGWIGPKGALMAGSFLELTSEDPSVGVVNWSEHMVIVSNGYSLAFHSNTFDATHGGDNFIERRLLRIEDEGCKLFFHGVTYECERAEDSDEVIGMTVYWKEQADELNPSPELFTYRYTRIVAK